jgi:hypothetical protein
MRNRNTISSYKADLDFPSLESDATLEDVIKAYNELAKGMNFLNKFISFQSNFDGKISSVTIAATSKARIQHFLGVIPKWRVILRQEGNGVITDVSSEWTDKYITLYNNGAESVTLSLLIARE